MFMIGTIVVGILMYILVLFKPREDASILTSSLVLSYSLYLQWSALSSLPDETCNPFFESSGATITQVVLGLSITFIALLYASSSTDQNQLESKDEDQNLTSKLNTPLLEDEDSNKRVADVGEVTAEDMHVFPISSATILFQLLLVFASMYYAMMLTNWGSPTLLDSSVTFFEINTKSYWI